MEKKRKSHSRRFSGRKRICRVCEHKVKLSYKRPQDLKTFINRLGKILPRRTTRLCAKHQRAVALEIRRARYLALLPFVVEPEASKASKSSGRGGGRRR